MKTRVWRAIAGVIGLSIICCSVHAEEPELQPTTTKKPKAQTVSAELARMFQHDQNDRLNKKGVAFSLPDDWKTMVKNDKKRRARVLELLKQDKIKSADDCFHAAMILQHGETAEHYALAHVLATAAAMKGNKKAAWLAAASFDRLMVNIKQPQMFGTQFFKDKEKPYKLQEPIDLSLIPDSIRKQFNVPVRVETEKQLEMLNAKK